MGFPLSKTSPSNYFCTCYSVCMVVNYKCGHLCYQALTSICGTVLALLKDTRLVSVHALKVTSEKRQHDAITIPVVRTQPHLKANEPPTDISVTLGRASGTLGQPCRLSTFRGTPVSTACSLENRRN